MTLEKRSRESGGGMQISIKNHIHANVRVASHRHLHERRQETGVVQEFSPEGTVVSAEIYQNDQLLSEGTVNKVVRWRGHWVEY
jgi:hypothetical protein